MDKKRIKYKPNPHYRHNLTDQILLEKLFSGKANNEEIKEAASIIKHFPIEVFMNMFELTFYNMEEDIYERYQESFDHHKDDIEEACDEAYSNGIINGELAQIERDIETLEEHGFDEAAKVLKDKR